MMSREHHRRRSPESSRRRRKERRQSREQLQQQQQSDPPPASTLTHDESLPQTRQQPYQQPYQEPYQQQPYQQPYQQQQSYQEPYPPEPSLGRNRDRALSSTFSFTSTSSSTSSSLLNISRPSKGFGIGAFFSGDGRKQRRRIRKKRSKFLRFGNSSSSSVGSDLAYGRGYIDRRRSREFSPPGGQKPPRADSGEERPRPPKRAQTDEEIIELGRQFAEFARKKNAEDLRAAGRTRPSTLTGAVNALHQFRRTNSGNLNKGIGNSKPSRDSSSDDSDWESASSGDESSEEDSDNGLAYGSSHHLQAGAGRPSHFGASMPPAQAYPPSIPLNRKPSLVDPKLFGPINSLRGYVQTPCGFERVDRNTIHDTRPPYEPSVAPGEKAASATGRPLQHVYPVPTSDPSRFDAGRGSVVSSRQDSTPRPRPDPVPIQQPKPIAPVHTKVFDSVDTHPSYSTPQPIRAVTATTGPRRPDISAGKAWSSDAAIGALLKAARDSDHNKYKNTHANDTKWQPERSSYMEHNEKHETNDDALRDLPSKKPYEQESKITRDDKRESRHQEKAESDFWRDFERERRRRDRYHDDPDRTADVEVYKKDSRDSEKSSRRESRREERREDQPITHEPKIDVPAPSKGPDVERPKETIDPFQYQVADDAFSTRHGTPLRPLTPVIMTVEREPDFSRLESHGPYERLSRKDSFERELQEIQKARRAAERTAVPVSTATFADAAVAEIAEPRPERSPKADTSLQGHTERSSSSPQPKDPVLDDADRAYREARLARRIKEQEERSRSSSPDKSVVDKWKDAKRPVDSPQTGSSVEDRPKQKSRYDGPDADVRIDNVLEHPKELARFRISESRRRSSTFPVFSARDPSAERERPMLNLIRPTPAPSPAPENRRPRDVHVPSIEIDDSSVSTEARDVVVSAPSTSPPKAVSWGENETKHYIVETPEREDDPYSGTKVIIPAETPRSQPAKKVDWSAVAAAISGASVGGIVAASSSDATVDTEATRDHVESRRPPKASRRRSSLQFDSLYEDPPIPGPKPSIPRSSRTTGSFTEDPGFMAHIAAGLEGSGFDPNIIIDDTKFHRRDSPPGSDELFSPSVAATSRGELQDTSGKGKGISHDDSEIPPKTSRKKGRKQREVTKQETSDKSVSVAYDDSARDTSQPVSDEEWDVPVSKFGRKEQKKRDKGAKIETWEEGQVFERSSTERELEPIIDDWASSSLKKKPKKPTKSSRTVVVQQDSRKGVQNDPQRSADVELSTPADLADWSRDFEKFRAAELEASLATRDEDVKAAKWKPSVRDFDERLESISQDPQRARDFDVALEEEPTASSRNDKKKKAKRGSAAGEPLPSTASRTVVSELPHESSFQIVEPELHPLLADKYDIPKGTKKGERDLANIGSLQSMVISETQEKWSDEKNPDSKPLPGPIVSRSADIVDSSYSLTGRTLVAGEEEDEWEDLPKKPKKKKKSRYDTSTPEESSHSAFPAISPSGVPVEGSKKTSNETFFEDSPSRLASQPSTKLEDDGQKTVREKDRGAPGGFPDDEDLANKYKLPDAKSGVDELKSNRGSGNASFFDRFKSSIGFGEGKQQSNAQDESFLGNAGALEASAGLMGAVRALVPRKSPEKAADATPETVLPREAEAPQRHPSPPPEAEFIDPEIVEREIRPAIDPTYGDLLPLPPSRPQSPAPNLDESIPPLPESRPGTPEDDRERLLLSQKSAHVRRRSDTPLRLKTPSQSAIPIQFRLGQRSTPASPGILKQSPSGSPIVATPETASTSKVRARPMSWESTRAFKPLLLVERTSRDVSATPTLLEEEPRPSDVSDRVSDESYLPVSYRSIPHDDLHDRSSTQEIISKSSGSPRQSLAGPEEEHGSPDPVDAVSKNRSSYLLHWSPPNTQSYKDDDMSESSPTLRAAQRRIALEKLTEEAPDDITDIDLSKPAATDLATNTLVASAVTDVSRDVAPDTKEATTSDETPLGESTQIGKELDANEIVRDDTESSEAVSTPEAWSKTGKEGKDESREVESLAEASSAGVPLDLEFPMSSDSVESAVKTVETEDRAITAKPSKKDKKKKKKRQSQQPTIDDSKPIEASLPVEDQDEFFDAPAAPVIAESKPKEAGTDDLIEANVEAPTEAPAEVSAERPPEELAEASIQVPIEAPTETSIEPPSTVVQLESAIQTPHDTPVESIVGVTAEAPRDVLFEAPAEALAEVSVEAPITAPTEAPIEVLADVPVEGPAEALTGAPTHVPVEPPTEAPIEGLKEVFHNVPAETSIDIVAEATVDTPVEIPADGLVKTPEASVDVLTEASTAAFDEGLIDAPLEAPTEALIETPSSEEPLVKTKKAKKKKRKSQAREPEPEDQVLPPISEDQKSEGAVANDQTIVEETLTVDKESTSEQEVLSVAPGSSTTASEQDRVEKGRSLGPQETTESTEISALHVITPTENLPSNVSSEIVHSDEMGISKNSPERAQSPPMEAEHIFPKPQESTAEDTIQASATDKERPAATSKKSKKKKKGKSSQTREPEPEPLLAEDVETATKMAEEPKQENEAELSSSRAPDEPGSSLETVPSEHASTPSLDNLPDVSAETNDPISVITADELGEKSNLAQETPQLLSSVEEAVRAEVELAPEETEHDTYPSESQPQNLAGELSVVPTEEHTTDVSQPPEPNDAGQLPLESTVSGDIDTQQESQVPSAIEYSADDTGIGGVHATPEQSLEVVEPSTTLPDISDTQVPPADQLASDESKPVVAIPEESRSKKKGKKGKKTQQSISSLSDTQEIAADLAKVEDAQELPTQDLSSMEQAIQLSPTQDDTALDSVEVGPSTDAAPSDIASPIRKSKKSKKGKKSIKELDPVAPEVEESPKQEEVASDNRDIIDREKSVLTGQAESSTDDPWPESTTSEKEDAEKGQNDPEVVESGALVEGVDQPTEADAKIAEGDGESIQQVAEPDPLSAPQAKSELPEPDPETEVVSSKKSKKKKKRASVQLDAGSSDIISETIDPLTVQQDASVGPEPSEAIDASIPPAENEAALDATEVAITTQASSPVSKKSKKKKRQSIVQAESEDTSDLPGPSSEPVSDMKEVSAITEQVKEDDADISSTSTSTKKSKKDKKKKRQSVQFADPIEESTPIPIEGSGGLDAPELTTEPREISPDIQHEPDLAIPTELTRPPPEASLDISRDSNDHSLLDSTTSGPADVDPSSVPLPAGEELDTDLSQTVSSPRAESYSQLEDASLLKLQNDEQTAGGDQQIDSQLQDNIDNFANTQPQGDIQVAKPVDGDNKPVELDMAVDAPAKADDSIPPTDSLPAEIVPVEEGPASVISEEKQPSVTKKGKKDKKKRKGKSLEIQESVSDSPASAATTDDPVPIKEDQEFAPGSLPKEAETEHPGPIEPIEQAAVEQLVSGDPSPELIMETKKDEDKPDNEVSATEPMPVASVFLSPTPEGEANSEENMRQSTQEEEMPEVLVPSDTPMAQTDVAESSLDKAPVTSVPTPEDPLVTSLPTSDEHAGISLPTLEDQDQPIQDSRDDNPPVLEPEDEIRPLTDLASNDPSTEQPVASLTLEPELSVEAQASSTGLTVGHKSEKDKNEKQDNLFPVDQPDAIKPADTESISNIQTPVVEIEQVATETSPEITKDPAVSTQDNETKAQETDPASEVLPASIIAEAPINMGEATDPLSSSELPADQLPIVEAALEDAEGLSNKKTKKDKKKKKKQTSSEDNEPSPPESQAQFVEDLTPVQESPATDQSISVQPQPPEDDDTSKSSSAKKTKKSKKKKKLASSLDEEVPSELPAESTQPSSDSPEQKDDSLPLEPSSSQVDVPSKTEGTLQVEEAANIEDTASSALPEESHQDEKERELAGEPNKEAVSEPQIEPAQASFDNSTQDAVKPLTELESSPIEEPLTTEDATETSSVAPAKKSKKNKKKKKASGVEEEVPSENKNDLADPLLAEAGQLDVVPIVPAEAFESKDIIGESVSKDSDAVQDEVVPQDDSTSKDDSIHKDDSILTHTDATLDTVILKNEDTLGEGNATQTDAVLQVDSAPQHASESGDAAKDQTVLDDKAVTDSQTLDDPVPTKKTKKDKKKKKTSSTRENESSQDSTETSAEVTTVDLPQFVEHETLVQEPEHDKSLADTTTILTNTDNEAKEEQPSSWADELLEEQVTEQPILTASTDFNKPAEDAVLVPAPELPNDDAVESSKGKKSKKSKKKKQSISQDIVAPTELADDSATAAPSDVIDLSTNETPIAEPSNDDSFAQLTPTKKGKKDKKKKQERESLEDNTVQQETSNVDPPREESTLQGESTLQEPAQQELTQQELAQQELTQEEPPLENLSAQEPPEEQLPVEEILEEQPSQVLTREEMPEIAQDIPALADTEQATLLQEVAANISSEPTTILETGVGASDEATRVDVPPSDSLPDSTPTKKGKKDKKKKKSISSVEPEALPQEQPAQTEESQPLEIVDSTREAESLVEIESIKPATHDDAKEDEVADLASAKKGKKDKKKKKKALLETDPPQEPVEASSDAVPSLDTILPAIPDSSEQADVEPTPPIVSREIDTVAIPSTEKSENDGKIKEKTQEEEALPQPELSQEPDISRDASVEASQSETPLEATSSKKKKKDKKKKRASVGELKPEPGIQAGDNQESAVGSINLAEPTEIVSSSQSAEQSSANAIEDQATILNEVKTPSQDEVPRSPSGPEASESAPTQETAPPIKLDDLVEPTRESSRDMDPTKDISEDTMQEPPSENQQSAPPAAEDGSLQELVAPAGPETTSDSVPSGQDSGAAQVEAAPKVDDKMDTVVSKKSKKDKKKKKRASQVSWELGPEAEIEDLLEQQQPQEAFDEQPMTSESAEMGNSEEAVEDPISEFASGKKSKQDTERQSQMDWVPEPTSDKTVKESEPLSPSQPRQYHDVLLDHQSLAEDTQTSLKDSTNLDYTLPETSSKKSKKKKKKATILGGDVEPAAPVASEPAANAFLVEQSIVDKPLELADVPTTEAAEIIPEDEANTENVPLGITSADHSAIDIPRIETDTDQQPAQSDLIRSSDFASQIVLETSETPIAAEDTSSSPENPSAFHQEDVTEHPSRDLLAKEIEPLISQIQDAQGLTQDKSAVDNANTSNTAIDMHAEPLHGNPLNDQDASILPSKLEEVLPEAASGDQAEVQNDTTAADLDDLPEGLLKSPPKLSKKDKKKLKKAQALSDSDVDPKTNLGTDLQSWDWSSLDNQPQPATTPSAKAISVPEASPQIEPQAAAEPSEVTRATSQQEQKEEPGSDNVDSHASAPAEPELQPQLQPEPDPEPQLQDLPTGRRTSKKDKKKKKGTSQSESESPFTAQPPQEQESKGGSDRKDVTASELMIEEAKPIQPLDDENKAKEDQERRGSLPSEKAPRELPSTSHSSQEPRASEIPTADNQSIDTESLPAIEAARSKEQADISNDAATDSPANVPEITEDGQLPITLSRPRTPSPNRQVRIAVDMSPAQLSSHIEHDPPFDQSTQPDKKVRTDLIQDDTIVPEPLSAMVAESRAPTLKGSDSQITDAMTIDVPPVSIEPTQQVETDVVPDHPAPVTTTNYLESDHMNVDGPQIISDQKESQDGGVSQECDKVTPGENGEEKEREIQINEPQVISTSIVDSGIGAETQIVEEVGESKKAKGKKRAKSISKETPGDDKFDDHEPLGSSERTIPGEGYKLDSPSSNFPARPATDDAEPSSQPPQKAVGPAASEQVFEPMPHQDLGADNTITKSPVKGSEMGTEIPKIPDTGEISPQIKERATANVRDILDDFNTPGGLEGDHKSRDVSATEPSGEPFLPFLPPPRTPSALDYSRSLPPVEEETHEDLEKELQSELGDKLQTVPEAIRDSGFITGSPGPRQHNLDAENNAGQRDSGVHMEEKAGSEDGGVRADSSPVDDGSSSQTPQPQERRSGRSLFDNETPKLSTPTQGRSWDRGATPEKPAEEEPLKRTTTPLKPHTGKYQDLASSSSPGAALHPRTSQQQQQTQQTQRSVSDNITDMRRAGEAAIPQAEAEAVARRSVSSNTSLSRLRTPEPLKFRPESPGNHSIRSMHSIRSLRSLANTPPLRRVDRRMSGDLRSLSHSGGASTPSLPISTLSTVSTTRDKDPATRDSSSRARDKDKDRDRDTAKEAAAPDRPALHTTTTTSTTPIANEGRVRAKDMTDVYDGYGEGRIGSPRSPTRPPSMRRRQSMQVMELESRVEQLLAENRALADARAKAEQNLNYRNTSAITDRDAEIEGLKASLQWLQNEVTKLTEVNEGLQSANSLLALQHNDKYNRLESQHTTATRELEEYRGARDQFTQSIQAKDAEIQELRNQLEATKEQIREMKKQILATKPPDADFLRLKDEDHFDHRCQQLCSHVQQWVLRFSKFSDMRACRPTSEINDEKIIDRLDNTILDGSDVDDYLSDRVARRDIFMSMTMNMIWEFVFTRYLFGMDREQRQKLKSLEKLLTDVGPHHAVRQWRAITLTLLSRRPVFGDQRNQDTEAVVQAILQTLSMILPPPSNLEAQIQSQLRRVMREAVDLSIEMRTQRAEYMMLPPLQPEYDANGELTQTVSFNAALMNERSGDSSTTNEAYEAQGAIVRCVLFPLVVKKGDDNGVGDDEIVVSPAQVLVAKARRSTTRMVTPSSDAGGVPLSRGPTPSTYAQSSVSVNMRDAPLTPPGYN